MGIVYRGPLDHKTKQEKYLGKTLVLFHETLNTVQSFRSQKLADKA